MDSFLYLSLRCVLSCVCVVRCLLCALFVDLLLVCSLLTCDVCVNKQVLVATNLAARGLDFVKVDHVVCVVCLSGFLCYSICVLCVACCSVVPCVVVVFLCLIVYLCA